MPETKRPLAAALALVAVNAGLCLSLGTVYDFVCDLPYWERRLDLVRSHASAMVKEPASSMKLAALWRKSLAWLRYDLPEIVFPSSIPDPPHLRPPPRRRLTWQERQKVLVDSWVEYKQTWMSPREDRSTASRKDLKGEMGEATMAEEMGMNLHPSHSIVFDAVIARVGGEGLKPALRHIYMTRAAAYRDALQQFVAGYQEGVSEVSAKLTKEVEIEQSVENVAQPANSFQQSKNASASQNEPN
eukprot:SM000035S13070  [mRNA]  locus=s35:275875:277410:- [translate_table: standard]